MFRSNSQSHKLLLVAALIAILSIVSGCTRPTPGTDVATQQPETAGEAVGLANPASVNCTDKGGVSEIRKDAQGNEVGYCLFPDGSECEEWAFMNGECMAGHDMQVAPTAPTVPVPGVPAPDIATDDLVASLQSELPENAYMDGGVAVKPLNGLDEKTPLWMAYSYGMRNWDLETPPSHFVAIYTNADGQWQELSRLNINEVAESSTNVIAPDFLMENGVQQVALDPSRVWITVDGGMGAHSGAFDVLSFDGQTLELVLTNGSASQGAGSIADVNGDGVNEVVLNTTDPYVFCYACGVRRPSFEVHTVRDGALAKLDLAAMPEDMQDNPAFAANNKALEYAQAGLWHDALMSIDEAATQAGGQDVAIGEGSLLWNQALIRQTHDAHGAAIKDSAYPLLNKVFYGDYAGAVEDMRQYTPEQIFATASPLISGTVAEGWEQDLAQYISKSADAALAAKPDLAPAYFVRAWGENLATPGSEQVLADLTKAAELAPDDTLFADSLTNAGGTVAGGAVAGGAVNTPAPEVVISSLNRMPLAIDKAGGTVMMPNDMVNATEQGFMFAGVAGQAATIDVAAPQNDMIMQVVGADGTALLPYAKGASHWQGQLPTTQNYYIDVKGAAKNTVYRVYLTLSAAH